MVELLSVIAFAVALSMDGFGVGVSYGMRRIRIPVLSLVVISLTSATAIGISMFSGHLISNYISIETAEILGAVILIGVGTWILLQTWSKNFKRDGAEEQATSIPEGDQGPSAILNLRIKPLGLVIQILREPTMADLDNSGNISAKEALMLGLALAMDALGAGFGAAMTGFKPLLTPFIVGIVKFLMVMAGVQVGRRYTANWLGDRAAVFPGWVLILLGIIRVIKI